MYLQFAFQCFSETSTKEMNNKERRRGEGEGVGDENELNPHSLIGRN